MRTTLNIDDDLARELSKLARRLGVNFEEVVNETIRRGLPASQRPEAGETPFVVEPMACGLRAGIDPAGLNRLLDELDPEGVHALETSATVHSNDTDFGRFPGLRWTNPLAEG